MNILIFVWRKFVLLRRLLNCLSVSEKNLWHLRKPVVCCLLFVVVGVYSAALSPQLGWQPETEIMKGGVRKWEKQFQSRPDCCIIIGAAIFTCTRGTGCTRQLCHVSAPAQRSKCTFTNNAVSIGYLFNLDNFPNSGTCSYPTSRILCSWTATTAPTALLVTTIEMARSRKRKNYQRSVGGKMTVLPARGRCAVPQGPCSMHQVLCHCATSIYFLQEMTKTIPILGSRQIGPRQIGPLENVGATNWAPGILLGQGCKNYIPKYLVHKYSYTNTA